MLLLVGPNGKLATEQCCAKGMTTENKLGQIFEVLTPAQGYLMDKTFVPVLSITGA